MSVALGEPLQVLGLVGRALDAVGAAYAIGGSVASSVYGEPRSTLDGDLVAALFLRQVEGFISALGPDFFADAEMIRSSIRAGEPFNLIHLPTMFKVDVFLAGRDELALEELARRQRMEIQGETVYIATAEDIVLQKLVWFRKGNEVSERQWSDIRGVIRVQGSRLDLAYLRQWAPRAGVADLLERALREAAEDLGA